MNRTCTLKIAAVTVNRSDFGRMRPIYQRLHERTDVDLQIIATGSHFDRKFGNSIHEIRSSDLCVHEAPVTSEEPLLINAQITTQLGLKLAEIQPDLLLILGDRHEMLACAQAAMYRNVPIIHVGGGYLTEGAIDDRIRHAITKLSHLHLVANQNCAQRVIQMGEDPETVHIVGAPDLDMVRETECISKEELMAELLLDAEQPFILVTIHPETHQLSLLKGHITSFFDGLSKYEGQVIITAPAAEDGADFIFDQIYKLVDGNDRAVFRRSLGQVRYVSAMKCAAAIVGNSSSGIIEASYFPVPVVNVGDRQKGRMQGPNVINVNWDATAVSTAITKAVSPEFKASLTQASSPYGDGHTADRILEIILNLGSELNLAKPFYELGLHGD